MSGRMRRVNESVRQVLSDYANAYPDDHHLRLWRSLIPDAWARYAPGQDTAARRAEFPEDLRAVIR